jgi:hypothetical protein
MFRLMHSGLRYVVLALALAVLAYSIYGAITRRPYDKTIRKLGSAFAGSLHLQLLLGIALGLTGRFSPQVMGHVMMMLFAAATAQIPVSVMRRRPPEARTYLPHVAFTIVTLALVYWGLATIGFRLVG